MLFSRMVTNSPAAVEWIPVVALNCALVAPHFSAIARPWFSRSRPVATIWHPGTRPVSFYRPPVLSVYRRS
jgi:hypothetical protein